MSDARALLATLLERMEMKRRHVRMARAEVQSGNIRLLPHLEGWSQQLDAMEAERQRLIRAGLEDSAK